MKTNVNCIFFFSIIILMIGCSPRDKSLNEADLINIIKTDDLDKLKFNKSNIYIVPEQFDKDTSYFIQSRGSAFGFIVNEDGLLKTFTSENITNFKNATTLYKIENNKQVWEIRNKKELIRIELHNDENSDFEIVKSKRE
ncbi:MAG TPA: hypothetical protein PK624_03585 [Spirochaetota bacterium]|nr:hypothetical protein [Spirochaetota bacterium]HPK55972.1 hypothetical protein [Spirochaetota bacterium]